MTDRQELLLVLVVLYLAECFRWVRRGSVAFRRLPGSKFWQRREASEFMANDHGDLHWTFPLPPFGDFAVARGFPWSASPEGVATWHPSAPHPNGRPLQPATFRRWEEIREVELAGDKIFVAGELWWISDSQSEAYRLGGWLKRCAELPPPRREASMREQLSCAFDLEEARKQLTATAPILSDVRFTGQLIWCLLMVLLPLAIWRNGWIPALPFGLMGIYALCLWNARQTIKAHRMWYPKAALERFRLKWLTALSPVTSVRAAELLGRNRIEMFDPLTISLATASPEAARRVAATWSRDAWYPRIPENPFPDGTPASKCVQWFGLAHREAGTALLNSAGIAADEFRKAPAPTETVHTQYCNRCEAQFLPIAKQCAACGGRSLSPL